MTWHSAGWKWTRPRAVTGAGPWPPYSLQWQITDKVKLSAVLLLASTALAGSNHFFATFYDDLSPELDKRGNKIEDFGNVANFVDFSTDSVDRVPLANDWYGLVVKNGPQNAEILNDYEREHGIEKAVEYFNQTDWKRSKEIDKRGWTRNSGNDKVCCSNNHQTMQGYCYEISYQLKENLSYCNVAFYHGTCVVRAGSKGCVDGRWIQRAIRLVNGNCLGATEWHKISGYAYAYPNAGNKKICVSANNGCSGQQTCY